MAALQPLHVYRGLLRSAGAAFRGDVTMLSAAQQEIRSKFESSRAVSDAEQRQQLLAEAAEVAAFLRTSVVQAAVNERGHYEVAISEEHTGALVEQVTPDMKLPRVGGGPKAAAVPKAAKPRAAQP